jgi:hypothetical protein
MVPARRRWPHNSGVRFAFCFALGTLACGPQDVVDRETSDLGVGGVLRPPARAPQSPAPGNAAPSTGTEAPKTSSSTEPTITPAPSTPTDDGGTPEPADAGAPDAELPTPNPPDPNLSDVRASDCKGVAAWKPGGTYLGGEKFTHGSPQRLFQCRPWPYAPWCSLPSYEPGLPGGPWIDAWIHKGICP